MTKQEIIAFLGEHKQELERRFGVGKIGLFGSYARDEAREGSDVDIVVELRREILPTIFLAHCIILRIICPTG